MKQAFHKKILVVIFLGVGVGIVFGLYNILNGFSDFQKEDNLFSEKFNQLYQSENQVKENLAAISVLLNDIFEKEKNKDYQNIVKNLKEISEKIKNTNLKIEENSFILKDFRQLIESSSQTRIKETGNSFLEKAEERNEFLREAVSYINNWVEEAVVYYQEISENKRVAIDWDSFLKSAQDFYSMNSKIIQLGFDYEKVANDFARAANFKKK